MTWAMSQTNQRAKERVRESNRDGTDGRLLQPAPRHHCPLPLHHLLHLPRHLLLPLPLLPNHLCNRGKQSGSPRLGAQYMLSAFMLVSNLRFFFLFFKESTKRPWNHQFNGRVGEWTWNGSAGKFRKRAWNSQFSGGMGKRAWVRSFSGGLGK